MRAFQFRLQSYKRIKRYQIEEIEREIGRLEEEVQRRLNQIEINRGRVGEFQRFFMEETPEIHSSQVEATEAAFRGFMMQEEFRLFREIEQIRKQQAEKRKELVKLYQEEKMLERLKEHQLDAWQKESQREEVYLLDEMGGQSYARRRRPSGGAMLLILGVVALLGAAGGILVALGKHKMVLERLGLLKPETVQSATDEVTVAPIRPGEYTIRELVGDVDRPSNETLNKMMTMSETLRERQQREKEERARLETERQSLELSEKELEEKLSNIQDKIDELEKKQQEELARQSSRHMQRVTEVSNAVQRMKPKGAAELLTEMWGYDETKDPDAKNVVLDVFRAIPAPKRNKILDALVKSSKTDTAAMVLEFIQSEPSMTPTPETAKP